LISKLIAYTILGALLGLLGQKLQLSLTATFLIQLSVGIFMLGTALNLLNVHPFFRYFAIQPPKFLFRLVRNQSKNKNIFAPAILGAATVLIPCGTTQAMMALAISTTNPLLGALILAVFVLGTSPLFFTFGYVASRLSGKLETKFTKIVALILIGLSIYTLNGAIALTGTNWTLQDAYERITRTTSIQPPPVSEATITFTPDGYTPTNITVKAGSHVKLTLDNKEGYGCVQAFTIPNLGVQEIIQMGSKKQIEFNAPTQPTQIAFMCSMGMFRGKIIVI